MKHQQVVVDYAQMFKTSLSCIVLVVFVWIFIKLVQTIFILPRYLQRNHDIIAKTLEQHSCTDEELKAFEKEQEEEAKKNNPVNEEKTTDESKKTI